MSRAPSAARPQERRRGPSARGTIGASWLPSLSTRAPTLTLTFSLHPPQKEARARSTKSTGPLPEAGGRSPKISPGRPRASQEVRDVAGEVVRVEAMHALDVHRHTYGRVPARSAASSRTTARRLAEPRTHGALRQSHQFEAGLEPLKAFRCASSVRAGQAGCVFPRHLRSRTARSQPPRVAPASYTLSQKTRTSFAGSEAARTAA